VGLKKDERESIATFVCVDEG